MKKIIMIVFAASLFAACKSTTAATAAKDEKPVKVQYRDDFRSATEKEKATVLKQLKATGPSYSILILTQNYIGERITASNAKGRFYSGYAISDKRTGIADKTRIDNRLDTRVYDNSDKHEVIINAEEAQKHKFIYLMKNPGAKPPYTVTYSNTLRPLE